MKQGTVKAICVSEKRGTKKKEIQEATFVEDFGIEQDALASPSKFIIR